MPTPLTQEAILQRFSVNAPASDGSHDVLLWYRGYLGSLMVEVPVPYHLAVGEDFTTDAAGIATAVDDALSAAGYDQP